MNRLSNIMGLACKSLFSKLVMLFLLLAVPAKADDLATWQSLLRPDSTASFNEYASFILTHPDWPKMNTLREEAERRAPATAAASAYFAKNPPLTIEGLRADINASEETIRTVWLEGIPTLSEQRQFLSQYSNHLTPSLIFKRASRLVWDSEYSNARDLLSQLDAPHRAVINARIALRNGSNADGLISTVPANLQSDAGLLHDRVRWRNKNDNESGAIALLRQYPNTADGDASAWWKQRDSLAHWALEYGDSRAAYEITSKHGFSATEDGVPYMEAEWMAGWIALRFLNDPSTALTHFTRLNSAAISVVSKGRGAYWTGRAAAALGDTAKANQWYEAASGYSTTFYGQIAALDRYGEVKISAPRALQVSTSDRQTFDTRALVKVARQADRIGDRQLETLFLKALVETITSQAEATLTAELATKLGRKDLATWTAKVAGRKGFTIGREGYPTMSGLPSSPKASIIHAIIRQESGFDSEARSPAGALGLMQLMPPTARMVAQKMGVAASPQQLTSNPQLNIRLGSYLLTDLLGDFGNSLPMAAIGYNAGPGRASDWAERFGDPRASSPAILRNLGAHQQGEPRYWLALDIIESYPFSETRFYIHQVLANAEVYRAVLSDDGTAMLAIKEAVVGCKEC